MAPIFSNRSKNRILVLTAGFGDGHNAAARNIRQALESEAARKGIGDFEATILDLLDEVHPVISAALRGVYRFGITYTPGLWHRLYHFSDQIDPKSDPLGIFTKSTLRLKQILESYQPAAVVSTYMVYPQLLERISGRHGELPFPTFTVVTDSGSINAVWLKGRTNRFFVADGASKETLIQQSIPDEKIDALGFPIGLDFEDTTRFDAGAPAPPRVLYFPMTSKSDVKKTLHAITGINSGLQLTVVLGRNEKRLGRTVHRTVKKRKDVEVIGWTDRVPELLGNHHAIIGKAGGASVQEAMAASKPLILNYVVPGQEEGNARLAEAKGFGLRANAPAEVADHLRSLFDDDARQWKEMTNAAGDAARLNSARSIASTVLNESGLS
ncbi:MAG: glycosyltransferase [Verrucomicrobiota bacterium]